MKTDKWDKLYIYYISGTGNARKTSEWIADEAIKEGLEAVVQKIDRLENIVIPPASKKNLIGFIFPTHGFNTAPIMLKFIAGFPKGIGNNVLLVNTRAGMKMYKLFLQGISGIALLLPAFLLILKGYKCTGLKSVDMPSNWISLHPGLKINVVESIHQRCEKAVRKFTVSLLSGKKNYSGLYSLPLDIVLSPISFGYYIGGRFFLAKTFMANSRCNNCGICMKECPTESIKMIENRPYWKLSCESCMRCINFCPRKAIESTHGMAVLFWFIFTLVNAQLVFLIMDILNINPELLWWKILSGLIEIVGMVVITTFLYRIFHFSSKLKPFRQLIRLTSLTALPFWRRYNYFKEKKE
jgi:Pyruvate/2-oxoacid:ferredoxin oxidoreductase delta subunit